MAVIPILDSVTLQVNGPAFFRVHKPNKATGLPQLFHFLTDFFDCVLADL